MTYTYFIHRPADGLTKIGRSKSPKARICALGKKGTLVPLGFLDGDKEKEYHEKFASSRISGEWFKLDHVSINSIKFTGSNIPGEKTTGIRISSDLHSKLKQKAAQMGISLTNLCESVLSECLKPQSQFKPAKKGASK